MIWVLYIDALGEVMFRAVLVDGNVGPEGSTIIYTDVQLNVGNAYDGLSGQFTAPVAGYYMLVRTHLSASGCSNACTDLIINGVATSESCGEWVNTVEKSDLVQLSAGDIVWVEIDTCASLYGDEQHDTFSGYLLYQTI